MRWRLGTMHELPTVCSKNSKNEETDRGTRATNLLIALKAAQAAVLTHVIALLA